MTRWLFALIAMCLAAPAVAAPSSFILPATTTAYTAGQLMANSATGASVVVPSFNVNSMAGSSDVVLHRGEIWINDTTASSWNGQKITIDLWSAAPTFTNGDRSTFSPTTGTATHLAAFTCTMSSIYGDGVWGECSINTGAALIISGNNPVQVFWTATALTGSGTTGASKTVQFIPEAVR